jgi:hypothetical protein
MNFLRRLLRWFNGEPWTTAVLPSYSGIIAALVNIAIGMWKKGKSINQISVFLIQYIAVSTRLNEEQAIKVVSIAIEQFLAVANTSDLFPKELTDEFHS